MLKMLALGSDSKGCVTVIIGCVVRRCSLMLSGSLVIAGEEVVKEMTWVEEAKIVVDIRFQEL